MQQTEERIAAKPLVILAGPTAVGKTDLSIRLAGRIDGEIISADSMQVYKYMDIGSAKILPQQMHGIRHYGIDLLEPSEEYNAEAFQRMARNAMTEIWNRNKIPIVTGGTGFYIDALVYAADFTAHERQDDYRSRLQEMTLTPGGEVKLYEMLRAVDPASCEVIHAHNTKRIIRALEYYHETGQPISVHNEEQRKKESPYCFCYFVLTDDRKRLYQRIDARVDVMLREGLVEEVCKLRELGLTRQHVSMQGIGYKEILDYLNGITSYEEAVTIIKRDTRHFAKRQLTWFRRNKDVIFIDRSCFDNEDAILEEMLRILKDKNMIAAL